MNKTGPLCNLFQFYYCAKNCAIFCENKCNTGNVGNTKILLHNFVYIAQFCEQYWNVLVCRHDHGVSLRLAAAAAESRVTSLSSRSPSHTSPRPTQVRPGTAGPGSAVGLRVCQCRGPGRVLTSSSGAGPERDAGVGLSFVRIAPL